MTKDSEQLLQQVLKAVKLNDGFDPARIGGKIGLNKSQSESAARGLANAGILVMGFDCSAHFSPDYRKANAPAAPKRRKK